MSQWRFLFVIPVTLIGLASCRRSADETKRPAGHAVADARRAAPAKPDAAPKLPLIPTGAADAGTPAVIGPPPALGVEACDRYLQRHYRCITKRLPATMRGLALEGLRSTYRAWRADAAGSQPQRARLAVSCEVTLGQTRESMARYRCRY